MQCLLRIYALWMDRHFVRTLRHGRGNVKSYAHNKNGTGMSELWEKILNTLNYIGDHSGCHQIPERCFTVNGYTFPLCARCTGTTLGELAACVTALFGIVISPFLSTVMLIIMGLDWGIQYFGIRESTNVRRFITGILGGYGLFSLFINFGIWMLKLIF